MTYDYAKMKTFIFLVLMLCLSEEKLNSLVIFGATLLFKPFAFVRLFQLWCAKLYLIFTLSPYKGHIRC